MSSIEVRDEGQLRWIGLNRPDKRNAIDQAMSDELSAVRAGRALHDPGDLRRGRGHSRTAGP